MTIYAAVSTTRPAEITSQSLWLCDRQAAHSEQCRRVFYAAVDKHVSRQQLTDNRRCRSGRDQR